jgi:hypothetical protein
LKPSKKIDPYGSLLKVYTPFLNRFNAVMPLGKTLMPKSFTQEQRLKFILNWYQFNSIKWARLILLGLIVGGLVMASAIIYWAFGPSYHPQKEDWVMGLLSVTYLLGYYFHLMLTLFYPRGFFWRFPSVVKGTQASLQKFYNLNQGDKDFFLDELKNWEPRRDFITGFWFFKEFKNIDSCQTQRAVTFTKLATLPKLCFKQLSLFLGLLYLSWPYFSSLILLGTIFSFGIFSFFEGMTILMTRYDYQISYDYRSYRFKSIRLRVFSAYVDVLVLTFIGFVLIVTSLYGFWLEI